jgi:hypothetical protein
LNSKIILMVAVVVLSAGIVSAAPPFQQPTVVTEGYDIEYPKIEYVKLYNALNLSFHVYNASNGVPITNESTRCGFQLYNNTGHEIIALDYINKTYGIYDWNIYIDGNNFSKTGVYYYIFQCNTSDLSPYLGGYISHALYITESGTDPKDTSWSTLFFFVVMAVGFVVLGLVLFISKKFGDFNDN